MRLTAFLFLFLTAFCNPAFSQKKKSAPPPPEPASPISQALYESVQWRCIGPWRGGRSAAVTGVPGKPNLYYFGSTGGGVWRTTDGGNSWHSISDGFFGGSIGAVAVSQSDPNVIYVGGGEKTVRGNVSAGDGVWRSEDGGKSWTHRGLPRSRHIPRIRIHPRNPDLVYAAVLGDLFQSDTARGVYRSADGGKTWKKILYANADAGAIDLILDPNNPRILYASTWRVRRTPYSLESGGEGSALWKSIDGGDTWTNISANEGLPKGVWGIVGVTVSPLNSERVWAIIEHEKGGVYRSDDGGATWRLLNSDRNLRQRAWYYTRIYADTQDENTVYVVNVSYHKSTDGGATFKAFNANHGDHHDLWIAPEDNQRMVIGDDGGAEVSFDGGANWSTYHNQPTAQFYRVTTDNHFPYRIYGAQQDNTTVRILHRTDAGQINEKHWEETAGGESGHIAVDPTDNDVVYGGSYGGLLTRKNHRTGQTQAINVWPDNPMGHGAEGMRYRFQWNFPIFFSPHDPRKLYAASNHLHVSYNGGHSWEIISPDLTRNDPAKLGPSGGPVTKDNTGIEYYCTIFAAAESPYERDLIWAGSDDGLLHLTRGGGKSWQNVTPPDMPEWCMINCIEPDPHRKGGVYIAATSYKSGDYRPWLFRTEDYGRTWKTITQGIPAEHFTRAIRADRVRPGLLYAGTERGMYLSFDDGANWRPFQLNLPIVPITDLALKDDQLIAATQGRSFWIIDDLGPIRQAQPDWANKKFHLYQPAPAWRMGGWQQRNPRNAGVNHPGGVPTHFYLTDDPDEETEIKLGFYDAGGALIREFSTKAKEESDKLKDLKKGGNLFVWNMRHPDALRVQGMVLWWSSLSGPRTLPGKYKARLSVGDQSQEQSFRILADPRAPDDEAGLREQFDFIQSVNAKITETHKAIVAMRDARDQIVLYRKGLQDEERFKPLANMADSLSARITDIEETLYQTKSKSGQDPLNYPIRLNNKLAHLASLAAIGDYPPTEQSKALKKELEALIDAQLARWRQTRDGDIPEFNRMVREMEVEAIRLKKED